MADVKGDRPEEGLEAVMEAAEDEEDEGGRGGALLKLTALVLLVAGGIALARLTPLGEFLSREGIDRGIALVRGSPWAPLIFVAAYTTAMALALPGSVLTLAGGALFGFWWGVLFNTLGANLGANTAFLLARWLGRDGVERLAGDRLEKLDRATREYGFKSLLTLRLIPVMPFNALNFGSGLTAMSWGTYAAATAIGIFPGTVVYTMFADALLEGSREASREAFIRMIVAGALLVFLSFLPTIVKKLNLKITGGTAAVLFLLAAVLPGGAETAPAPADVPPAPDASGFVAAAPGPDALHAPDSLPDHDLLTRALEEHVYPERSRVDYAGLKADRAELDRYLESLATTDPAVLDERSREERLAFWINAYNACMVKQVVNHYPLTETGGGLWNRLRNVVADRPADSPWRIPDVFTRQHCPVAGADRSQDEIEHEIIRPMDEPRIHFAVNCAAVSCPALAAEAYTGERLDTQLDRQVRRFMAEPRDFRLEDGDPPTLTLNQVLEWYAEDFGGREGLKEFFADYVEPPRRALLRDPQTRVEYVEYDWTLNDVGN